MALYSLLSRKQYYEAAAPVKPERPGFQRLQIPQEGHLSVLATAEELETLSAEEIQERRYFRPQVIYGWCGDVEVHHFRT